MPFSNSHTARAIIARQTSASTVDFGPNGPSTTWPSLADSGGAGARGLVATQQGI
jgi:hypothetical protein